jgi:hypothetical protein
LKKIWHQEIAEMSNVKNNYIISVHVANGLKKKFYFKDMPTLMDVSFSFDFLAGGSVLLTE